MKLNPADPKTKKAAAQMVADRKQLESHKSRYLARLANPRPMPQWATEDAASEGRRQKAKGWTPLATAWEEWPEARAEYLNQFR